MESGQGHKTNDRVCVVIVTFNNTDMLQNLLDDLKSQTHLPDRIVLIDNGSSDDTENMVKLHYPDLLYEKMRENVGSAGGYHQGIRIAVDHGDFIYTLDDDVQLTPETISEIVKGYKQLDESSHCRVGAVRSVGDGHRERVPTGLEICPWRGTLFKREIIREVGLPSPDYFLYGEDLEYSLRLAEKGYCFYWIPTSLCRERRRDHDGKAHTEVFGRRSMRYQDPFRLYYAFRNEIFIYLRYRSIGKLLHTLLYSLKVFMMILATEGWAGRMAIGALAKGMSDGFTGRLGTNSSYIPG